MGWDEVKKINSNFFTSLDSLIYQQTLVQNTSEKSIEWVLRTSTQLGKVLAAAYCIDSQELEKCNTLAELASSPEAITAVYGITSVMDVILRLFGTASVVSTVLRYGLPETIDNFLDTAHVGKVFKAVLSHSGTEFDPHDTLDKIYSSSACMTALNANSDIVAALLKAPRALNLLVKGTYGDRIILSSHAPGAFASALNTCANNPSYFTRAPVAHYQNTTSTTRYHNIMSNAWSTSRPTQIAIYFLKKMYAVSDAVKLYSHGSGSISFASTIGSVTSGTEFTLNRFAIGTVGCVYGGTAAAMPTLPNGYGEAFIAI